MSHTFSKTWVSEETKEYEIWARIRDEMARICPHSPFVPKMFKEWLRHRVAIKEYDSTEIMQRIIYKTKKDGAIVPMDTVLGGRKFDDRRTLVLARESIWRVPAEEIRPGLVLAPWPTHEEYKHEGDDRNKSGYSRPPPLPRGPGNETVNGNVRRHYPNRHLMKWAGWQLEAGRVIMMFQWRHLPSRWLGGRFGWI